jgi:hypothetical protein
LSTATERSVERLEGGMGASVQIIPRRVAILGWIIPAPFVMPAIV